MITGIRGTLETIGPDWVTITVGGVSLQVSVPSSTIPTLGSAGTAVHLHTRLMVRDDSLVLHGFTTPEALTLFDLLIGVSGIGPRHAHSLLSAHTPEALVSAVAAEDTKALAQAPGLGQRTAARIIVELKGKLEKGDLQVPITTDGTDADAVSALTALGYTAAEVRRALNAIGDEAAGLDLEERVRRALGHLGSGG